MKTEGKRMLSVNKSKLRFNILNISSNKTSDLCTDSTSCCFPLTSGSNGRSADTNRDIRLTTTGATAEPRKPTRSLCARHKGLLIIGTLGILLLAIASMVYVINPIELIVNKKLSFNGESYLFHIWKKPPVTVYVKVFIFNVTNSKEFLEGAKLKLEEIGPFVYKEELEHTNVQFNPNNSVTYIPQRKVTWLPELSTNVPLEARLVVPNIPLIGFASMLANEYMYKNLGLAALASIHDSKPFLNVSVDEYLWGYDEPLVQFASQIFPNWIPFEKFGLLDRMFDDGDNVVTMNLNMTSRVSDEGDVIIPLTIDRYNGSPGLRHWGYDEKDNTTHQKCNTLHGIATEGVLFPRDISKNDTFMVYRKAFCRTLPINFEKEGVGSRDIPVYWYKFPEDVFDNTNPENSCYCKPHEEACLPRGLSDMTTCIYGIPAAVSFPHFYKSDPALLEAVEGLNPVKKDHESFVAIQPDFGIPMEVHSRIQTNVIVKHTKYNPRVAAFNDMVLPIFWVDLCIEELPPSVLDLLSLVVQIAPTLVNCVEIGFSIVGVALTLVAVLGYILRTRVFRTRKYGEQLWQQDYKSLRIVPVIRNEDYLSLRRAEGYN